MSRRVRSRYPHVFSKGRGVGFVSQGSWRGAWRSNPHDSGPGGGAGARGNPCLIQTQSLGHAVTETRDPANRPIPVDPQRWKVLKVSPTIAHLYRRHWGIIIVCARCLHGIGHRNPGLPDYFRRQWGLTLLEIEKKCRCEMCGARNARVYPWGGLETTPDPDYPPPAKG